MGEEEKSVSKAKDKKDANKIVMQRSHKRIMKFLSFVLIFFFYSTLFAVQEEETEIDIVTLPQSTVISGDYFARGRSIEISGTVNGDLYVLGGQVFIDGTVNGDVLVAGGSIEIMGKISQDVRLLGGQARIGGEIGKNVTAITGTIELSPSARIGKNVVILSGNVDLDGAIGNQIRIYASNVKVANKIGGDVKAYVGQMRITSRAQIDGSVEYWSNKNALIDANARIGKGIIQHPSFFYHFFHGKLFKSLRIGSKFAGLVMNFIYTLIVGLIILHYFPKKVKRTITILEQRPFQALIAGVVLLVLLPLAFLILLITILGMPFALTLLAVNVIGLYTAKIFSLLWVTKHLFRRFEFQKHIKLHFTFVLLFYFPLTLIPYLGMALSLSALLFGLGGMALVKKTEK